MESTWFQVTSWAVVSKGYMPLVVLVFFEVSASCLFGVPSSLIIRWRAIVESTARDR